ncbi:MAG: restriction endonuclease subunit S, partial [Muribaculaceae bacterium]|nr:restriction endonuclease subunit S [Muribaculaceae bacterium]
MTEWKTYKLGDIAKFQTGKLNSNAAIENGKYPFFTCSPNTLAIDNYAYDKEAILLAGNNAEGNFSIKYYKGKFNAYQRTYIIETFNDVCDIKFLFYALKICLQRFKLMSQGTSTKFLTAVILNNFEISLPPLEEQRRIAGILGAIDDKIENNRRINTNLELQAQALYKQWFVDNRSEDWAKIKLGEIIEISKKSITPSQLGNTIFEHYSLPAYDDGEQPTFDRGQDIKSSKFVIGHGMFLFSKLNPRIKRIWLPDIGTKHAICSTEFIPYKPKEEAMLGFCYSIVNSEHFYEYVLSLTNGSTGSHQRFHPIDTLEYSLYIPSESYIGTFEDLV